MLSVLGAIEMAWRSGAIASAGVGIATGTVTSQTNAYVTSSAALTANGNIQIAANSDYASFQVNAYIGGGGLVARAGPCAAAPAPGRPSIIVSGMSVCKYQRWA